MNKIDFRVGDTVRVYQKIVEGDPSAGSGQGKTRTQIFEGVVLAINRNAGSFTVRKIAEGIGVERIWSFASPWIEKVTVKKKAGKVRRAKLYFLRRLSGKQAARAIR
jgi:large subunit ribosomal protein L19